MRRSSGATRRRRAPATPSSTRSRWAAAGFYCYCLFYCWNQILVGGRPPLRHRPNPGGQRRACSLGVSGTAWKLLWGSVTVFVQSVTHRRQEDSQDCASLRKVHQEDALACRQARSPPSLPPPVTPCWLELVAQQVEEMRGTCSSSAAPPARLCLGLLASRCQICRLPSLLPTLTTFSGGGGAAPAAGAAAVHREPRPHPGELSLV